MKPAVLAGAFVALVAGLAALTRHPPPAPRLSAPAPSGSTRPRSLCPPRTLPDQGVCVPVPRLRTVTDDRSAEVGIPRRPDRPLDYARYVLPVAASGSPAVLAADPSAWSDGGVRTSGISISAAAGAIVSAVRVDGQDGPTGCVFAGPLFGNTVITRHHVRAGGRSSDYIVIIGNLGALEDLAPRAELASGAPVGKAGASPMNLETRLVRPGGDPFAVAAERLLDESETVPVDPRNLLPLR